MGTPFWLIAVLLSFGAASASGDTRATKIEHLEGGYSLEVPASLSIASGKLMPDFALYTMSDSKGKQLLLIYLGSAPDTRSEPPGVSVRSSAPIGGYPASLDRWRGKVGKFNGDTLIKLKRDSWPRFAHMIFRDLSRSEAELTERVVHSFRGDEASNQK
jgi:hypothetical protein